MTAASDSLQRTRATAAAVDRPAVPLSRMRRLPSLDGWRAVAILLVLASHMWASRNVPASVSAWLPGSYGDLGVRIFLVVSGFLITRLLLQEKAATGSISLRLFYIRRSLRILPVYLLFLLTLAALQWLGVYQDALSTWVGVLTFTRNMVGQGDSATGHLWSLAVEEQFYLLWPPLLLLLWRSGLSRTSVLLVILTMTVGIAIVARQTNCAELNLPFCNRVLGPKSLLCYADALAVGCAAAFLSLRWTGWDRLASVSMWGGLCVLVTAIVAEHATQGMTRSGVVSLQAFATASAIVGSIVANSSFVFRLLNSGSMSLLGRLSYSLYIWHMLFLYHYVGPNLGRYIVYEWWAWVPTAFVVAVVSYCGFEQPILRWKDRFKARS